MITLRGARMSENWHGRPAWTPPDPRAEEFHQNPPGPVRGGGNPGAPRHGTESAHRRNGGSQHRTDEYRPVADRRPPPTTPPPPPVARRSRRLDANPWHWLLFVPVVLPLIPGLYNQLTPALFGVPFFYWFQLAFAFMASGIIAFVHLKVR